MFQLFLTAAERACVGLGVERLVVWLAVCWGPGRGCRLRGW